MSNHERERGLTGKPPVNTAGDRKAPLFTALTREIFRRGYGASIGVDALRGRYTHGLETET